jgi:hypothetical protein
MSDNTPDVPETIWKYTDFHGVVKESWVMPVHGSYINIAEYTNVDKTAELITRNNELSSIVDELELQHEEIIKPIRKLMGKWLNFDLDTLTSFDTCDYIRESVEACNVSLALADKLK